MARHDYRTPRHVVENAPRMNPNPPMKPWVVRTIKRNRSSAFHPWFVELDNHYYMPGANGFKCSWNVDLDDERYDTSTAHFIEDLGFGDDRA